MSEFEDRENGLGELPEGISNERGDTKGYTQKVYPPPPPTGIGTPRPGGIPPDIQQQGDLARRESIEGTFTIGAGVTSTFDTRPINARDFLVTDTDVIQEEEIANIDLEFTFIIPAGHAGILRGFKATALAPLIAVLSDPSNVLTTLFVNDMPVPQYEDMILLPSATAFNPCHVVVDENQELKLRLRIAGSIGIFGSEMEYLVQFYGNLLVRTGRPVQYEQGNELPMKPIIAGVNT